MATVSTVPAVLDALIAACRAAVAPSALASVQIHDGPPIGDLEPDYVAVGWTQITPSWQASDTLEYFGGGGGERYGVPVMIRSWSGEVDIKARRDRAFALADAIADLASALTADGANVVASLTVAAYQPSKTAEGAEVVLSATVSVEALT